MKVFQINIFIALGFCLTISSCEDILEQVPESNLTAESFWRNEADSKAGLMSVYDLMQNLGSTKLMEMGDVRADILEMPADFGWDVENPALRDLKENIFSPSDGIANWSAYFNGIARANAVLSNVPDIEFTLQTEKDKILGEAYFLRAILYFYLVRNWGPVPIITAPYTTVDAQMYASRDPENEVYAQILEDLETAENLLPTSQSTDLETRIRATKGAAQSLMCDVLLTRGYQSFAGATDFQDAAAKAQEVINNANYSLVSGANYGTIFTNSLSPEIIFQIYYDISFFEENTLSLRFMPRAYTKSRPYGGDYVLMPAPKITDDHEVGDLRAPTNFEYAPDPSVYYDLKFAGAPYVAKFKGTVGEEGVLRYSDSNWIVYRLSDVILMRAEALAQSNQTTQAIGLLDQIRDRAGLVGTTASTKEEVLDAILNERMYELCFEGKRWYDLVRMGKVEEMVPEFNGIYLYPVPQSEVDINPNLLPQNPGF